MNLYYRPESMFKVIVLLEGKRLPPSQVFCILQQFLLSIVLYLSLSTFPSTFISLKTSPQDDTAINTVLRMFSTVPSVLHGNMNSSVMVCCFCKLQNFLCLTFNNSLFLASLPLRLFMKSTTNQLIFVSISHLS